MEILNQILEIVNSQLESDVKISLSQIEDNLIEHKMDSIIFIKIIVALEEKFNIEIPDQYLVISELATINAIHKVVLNELNKLKKN